jgi:two-component system CheB/CheR fusion protein
MGAEQGYSMFLDTRSPLQNGNGGGLHILVVEDDADTAESTAILLCSFGHRVQIASDGPAACQAALSKPPDVVLLDLGLPGMDGYEVARRLQAPSWEKRPFLIAITGYSSEEDRRRSLQAGIDLHLLKPVDPDFLRRLLGRFYRIILPVVASSTTG